MEQHLINGDDVARSWPYHASYVFDYAQQRYEHINDAFIAHIDRLWAVNISALLVAALVWLLIAKRNGERERPGFAQAAAGGKLRSLTLPVPPRIVLWIAAGLFAGFLMTRYSAPLGRLIPQIESGVFSWRLLSLTSLLASLLIGACWQAMIDNTQRWRRFVGGGAVLLLLLVSLAVSVRQVVWPMVRAEAFAPNPQHYNYATLPRDAVRETPPAPEAQFKDAQTGSVQVLHWGTERRTLRYQAQSAAELHLRLFNFPGWTATDNGQPTSIRTGAYGQIVLDAVPGEHYLVLEFRSTTVRRVGNWLTVVSAVLLLLIVAFSYAGSPTLKTVRNFLRPTETAGESAAKRLVRRFETPIVIAFFAAGSFFLLRLAYLPGRISLSVGAVLLLAFQAYVKLRYEVRIPLLLLLLCWLSIVLDWLGNIFGLYPMKFRYVQYDEFTHTAVPALVAPLGVWLLRAAVRRFKYRLPLALITLFAITTMFTLAGFYEILELWDDKYMHPTPGWRIHGPYDTPNDLQCDLLGLALGGLLAYALLGKDEASEA